MPWVIKPKRRTGSSGWPSPTTLQEGEICVNAYDAKIGMRVGSNIVEIANASSGDWNTLANRPDVVTHEGGRTVKVIQDWQAVDNNAYGGRFFVAEAPAGSGGAPGYGFHRAGAYGWFFYALANGFYGRRSDGIDVKILHEGQGENASFGASIRAVPTTLTGGVNSAFFADGTFGTQLGALAIRWNGNRIWQIGSETNGDFKIWSYDANGAYQGNPITLTGGGILTLNNSMRAMQGYAYGDGSYGGNITWNSVAGGVGASEYTNNRQGGSGGHLFSTRQNESQTPYQHHHMLSNGRMNIRNATGGWVQQPRIWSGGGDPGAAADPGDLWFQEV